MDMPVAIGGDVGSADSSSFDAIVVGAGVAGLYQLYKLREFGLRARIFEAGAAALGIGTATRTGA
jgi:ribulose 1,5-bisphosphate synthetase/thiazole synthase